MNAKIKIPADVPPQAHEEFRNNYNAITGPKGNILLFATDQKIEHLNSDFFGPGVSPDTQNPNHLFKIATQGKVNAMASHLGLIARYGNCYPTINYIIKLNGKTNLIKKQDPFSELLWTVDDVIRFKKGSNLNVRGIGFTLYLGSEHEPAMLSDAAQSIFKAHQHGLIAILWCYVRGKEIDNEQSPEFAADAAGLAAALGADIVKIKPPIETKALSYTTTLSRACEAAGNTKVVCSGGEKIDQEQLLQRLSEQLAAGTGGCAIGRNIFQRSLPEAINLTEALSAIIHTAN